MITIDAGIMRAAQACQPSNDTRFYLNGILLTADGDIVATNGIILFVGQYTANPGHHIESDTIISIDGAIPLGALSVELEFRDDGSGLVHLTSAKGRMPKILSFSIVDGTYPDYKRIMPPTRTVWENGVSMQAHLLAKIVKVFGKDAIVTILYGISTDAWAITSTAIPGGLLVIAPTRSPDDNAPKFKKLTEA